MKNITKELRKRLFFEYRYSNKNNSDSIRFLTEVHGVPNIIDEMSLIFKGLLEKYVKFMISSGKDSYTMSPTNSAFSNLSEYFFKNLNISIELQISNGNKMHFGYFAKEDNFDNGKLIDCDIEGIAVINKDSLENSISRCTSVFAHELTHAYEDWQRYSNGKENLRQNVSKYGYENKNVEENAYLNRKRLSHIIYYLTPAEIRAYCTQIIKKNEDAISKCTSSKQAFNIIKNDTIFQNYQIIEGWVDDICNKRLFCNKEDIVEWWEEITGRKYSYNRICNYLSDKMNKAKGEIVNNIAKKINDIALNNDKWIFLSDDDSPLKS